MAVFTKPAAEVFAPTTAGGANRGADMGEAQTWGVEVEQKLDELDAAIATSQDINALAASVASVGAGLTLEVANRIAGDAGLDTRLDTVETDVAAALAAALLGAKPRVSSVRLLGTVDTSTTTAMEAGDLFDSTVLVAGDRIAKCYNGATGHATNGIWIVQASGAAVRATDFNTDAEIRNGVFSVDEGTSKGQLWGVKNTSAITVDTTAIIIERVEAASGAEADVAVLEDTVIGLANQTDSATKTASKVIGLDGTPANGTPSTAAVYVFSEMAGHDGRITELWAYGEGAGTIEIRIYGNPAGNAVPSAEASISSLVWLRTHTLTIASGINTWSVANGALAAIGYPNGLPIAKNERVGWYGGVLLSYLSATNGDGGGYHPISGVEIPKATALLGLGAFNVQLQFGCRIEYPAEKVDAAPPWMVRPGYDVVLDKSWNHEVQYGQSNSVGADTAAMSTSPSIRHKTFNVGPKMTKPSITGASGATADDLAVKFLVEDNADPEASVGYGETSCFTFATQFTKRAMKAAASVPVWFASAAGHSSYGLSGGNTPLNAIDKLQPNSVWYPNLVYHIEAAKREAAALGLTYQVAFACFDGLETDCLQGASYALVRARLASLINNFRVDAMRVSGQTRRPIWLATTPAYGATISSGAIQALMDACEERGNIHFVCPGYRFPFVNTFHYSAHGQALKGAYYARAAFQYSQGKIPDRCWWRSVTYTGTTVKAVLSHPGSAITFNTAIPAQIGASGATPGYGIKIVDDTGTLTVVGGITIGTAVWNPVTQLYDSEITYVVNRALGANPKWRYARDYLAAGRSVTSGADGNIFDNTAETVVIGGATYVMAHAAPPCELSIISAAD